MHDTFFNVPDYKTPRMAGSHLWNTEQQAIGNMPAALLRHHQA